MGIDGAEIEAGNTASLRKMNEMNQFAFFLDLAHLERSGESYGEYQRLRTTTAKLHGPGDDLEASNAHLVVELSILKAVDVLMGLD